MWIMNLLIYNFTFEQIHKKLQKWEDFFGDDVSWTSWTNCWTVLRFLYLFHCILMSGVALICCFYFGTLFIPCSEWLAFIISLAVFHFHGILVETNFILFISYFLWLWSTIILLYVHVMVVWTCLHCYI